MSVSVFQKVARAAEFVDDTVRDTLVHPDRDAVLAICEGEDFVTLCYATGNDPDEKVQFIWLSNDRDTLLSLRESIDRVLAHQEKSKLNK